MDKIKLRKILGVLDPTTKINFAGFDDAMNKLKDNLKQQVQPVNLDPLLASFNNLKTSFEARDSELSQMIADKQQEIASLITTSSKDSEDKMNELTADLAVLKAQKIPDFGKQIKSTETKLMAMIDNAKVVDELEDEKEKKSIQTQFAVFEKQVKDLRTQFQQRGGGSMNRQMFINGSDPLTRYTDINLKAGSNVTLSYVNNNATKKVDITITSSGGGGGGGIARSINSISISTNAGSTSATDYVYLCTGTLTVTMPDATAGNTNLYTIKNVGTGVVTINTTSSQTIDGNLSINLVTQYTSVDLESDTTNWNIT